MCVYSSLTAAAGWWRAGCVNGCGVWGLLGSCTKLLFVGALAAAPATAGVAVYSLPSSVGGWGTFRECLSSGIEGFERERVRQ